MTKNASVSIFCCLIFLLAISLAVSAQTAEAEFSATAGLQAKDWIDMGSKVTTAALALLAGLFGWYKFVRGRVFHPRFQVSISARQVRLNGSTYVLSSLAVANVGTSRFYKKSAYVRLTLIADRESGKPHPQPAQQVLGRHTWIDSGETVKEEHLTLLTAPGPIDLYFRVEAKGPRRWFVVGPRGKDVSFSATAVALPPCKEAISADSNPS